MTKNEKPALYRTQNRGISLSLSFFFVMKFFHCLKHKCCFQRNKLQLPKLSQKSHVNWNSFNGKFM